MKLNVLYHHRTQGRGAEGKHIVSIVRALEGMGHTVTVVSPPGIDPLNPQSSAPVDKAKVETRGMQSFWKNVSRHLPNFLFELAEIAYNVPAYLRLRKVLKTGKYDLIYERYAFFMLAGALLARQHRIPFVLEANEVSGIESRARKQSYPRLCSWFERRLFKRCTGIQTVSSHLKKRILRQNVEGARVYVSPNAFDVAKVQNQLRNHELATRYDLTDRTTIGFAGWFDHWDRLDMLMDVFGELKQRHPRIALMLIGDGPIAANLKTQAQSLGLEKDVIFTGAVPRQQVYDYISLLDIAVLPHSNDFGSPVVMFEFMGLRIPVVAPRLEPILDVQIHDKTALLFDPLDRAGCRDAIERLIADAALRKTLASRAYEKLVAEHTWTENARKILLSAGFTSEAKA